MKRFLKEMFGESVIRLICGYIIISLVYTALLAGFFAWFVRLP